LKALAPDVKKVQPPAQQDFCWNPWVAKHSVSLMMHVAGVKTNQDEIIKG